MALRAGFLRVIQGQRRSSHNHNRLVAPGHSSETTLQKIVPTHFSWQELTRCSTPDARKVVPLESALKLRVLPLGFVTVKNETVLTVACPVQASAELLNQIRFVAGMTIRLFPVLEGILDRAIIAAYNQGEDFLRKESSAIHGATAPMLPEIPSQPTARFVHQLIHYAIGKGASDLHIIPANRGVQLKLRVQGELLTHDDSLGDTAFRVALVNRIKVLSGLNTALHHLPQDGAFSVAVGQESLRVRVATMPTIGGEKIVLRVLGQSELRALSELKLSTGVSECIDRFLDLSQGACLLIGPTGCGKTTTIAAMVRELQDRNRNIVTLEDPVEIIIPGTSQTSIDSRREFGYPRALRATLRQDPDVIVVGEIRDEESAGIALQAALTGHLLLSSVHASSIYEVFLRLQELKVPLSVMFNSIRLIVNQRLVALRCRHCHGGNSDSIGCQRCDYTGKEGRTILSEALWIDQTLRNELCRVADPLQKLPALVTDTHYHSVQASIRELVKEGQIGTDEFERLREELGSFTMPLVSSHSSAAF